MIMGEDETTKTTDSADIKLSVIDNVGKVASDLIAGIFGKEPEIMGPPAPGQTTGAGVAQIDYTPFVIVGVPLAAIAVFAALRK